MCFYCNNIISNIFTKYNNPNSKKQWNSVLIMSESVYVETLEKKTGKKIVYKEYNDFDSDGYYEMFAIVGNDNVDTIEGEVWYVNVEGLLKIEESKFYHKNPISYLFSNNIFVILEEDYATGFLTYIWGVKDGEPFQQSLTGKVNGIEINDYNEIVVTNSTYDFSKEIYENGESIDLGHTWNQYFYFWNGENFREYGAIEIEIGELLKIEGSNELLNYIKDLGATINEIFYRENNIIQINYQEEKHEDNCTIITYYYIMFRYEGRKIKLDDCFIREGNVLKALNTSLAVYPLEFSMERLKRYDAMGMDY